MVFRPQAGLMWDSVKVMKKNKTKNEGKKTEEKTKNEGKKEKRRRI